MFNLPTISIGLIAVISFILVSILANDAVVASR